MTGAGGASVSVTELLNTVRLFQSSVRLEDHLMQAIGEQVHGPVGGETTGAIALGGQEASST